ncbi:MAG: C1 family peptidase, partial [Planctomycetota bacterium]
SPPVSSTGSHPYWRLQKNVASWGLDSRNLPRKALHAYRYYGVTSLAQVNGKDPSRIEAVLRRGIEIAWDFMPNGDIKTHVSYDTNGTRANPAIWQPSATTRGRAHCMLIVGYDRRSSNSKNHYFICKNSWGSWGRSADGFTYVSYDYLKQYGAAGTYITGTTKPAAWPELAFLGRWNLSFDGHRGTLDIYHMPGIFQWHFDRDRVRQTDRRLGIFTDTSGKVHRVNGEISGNKLTFWFKNSRPVMGWGETRETPLMGRRFVYHMVNPYGGEMAGWHHSNSGTFPDPAWGGYARIPTTITGTNGFLSPSFNTSQAWRPEMYLGMWNVVFDLANGQLSLQQRNDLLVPASLRATCAGLQGEFIESGTNKRRAITATVNKSRPAEIKISFTHSTRGYVQLRGYMLSWQKGVFAGDAYSRRSSANGFYAYRTGSASIPGVIGVIGKGCRGTNGTLTQTFTGSPFLAKTLVVRVAGGPRSGRGMWVVGGSRSRFLFPGTKDCFLRVNPLIALGIGFNKAGAFSHSMVVPNDRKLIGTSFHSQFGGFDRGANAAGVTISNALSLRIGGYR